MNSIGFNFQHSSWLWALSVVPLICCLWFFRKSTQVKNSNLQLFADKHLLPLLLKNSGPIKDGSRKNLFMWSFLWTLGVLALAGPRWDFREVQSYRPQKNLVVLLSLSDSMDAQDLRPSRLVRARQKIEDILNDNPDVNIGLIGFGGDAHLVAPVTEDKAAIRYLLPALQTDLITVHGNYLGPALGLAGQLLGQVPGKEKGVLVMSDGTFQDANYLKTLDQLVSGGIKVSSMGFGTSQGAPLPNLSRKYAQQGGSVVLSKLDEESLKIISHRGNGQYFLPDDVVSSRNLFSDAFIKSGAGPSGLKIKDWEPRFYIFLKTIKLKHKAFKRRGGYSANEQSRRFTSRESGRPKCKESDWICEPCSPIQE
jgi:Ca-activated chloride channel family protein